MNHDGGRSLGCARERLCGERRNLLGVHDSGSVSRHPVKHRLHGHRALGQLGEVASFEMLSDAVVKGPERSTLELLMARVAEILHSLVNVTRRKCFRVNEIHNEISGTVLGNLRMPL